MKLLNVITADLRIYKFLSLDLNSRNFFIFPSYINHRTQKEFCDLCLNHKITIKDVVAATLGFIQKVKSMIEGFKGCFFKPDTIVVSELSTQNLFPKYSGK